MTDLVPADVVEGEVVHDGDARELVRRTREAKARAEGNYRLSEEAVQDFWDGMERLSQPDEATGKPRWMSLGYKSWEAFLDAEDLRMKPRNSVERKEIVGRLRELGQSTTMIADVIEADDRTVRRDLEAATSANAEVAEIVGKDGKKRAAKRTPKKPEPPKKKTPGQIKLTNLALRDAVGYDLDRVLKTLAKIDPQYVENDLAWQHLHTLATTIATTIQEITS